MTTPTKRPDKLSQAFEKLESAAEEQEIQLDESFFVELVNYSRHVGVEELDEPKLNTVVAVIGGCAMQRTLTAGAMKSAGGGIVREMIGELCDNPFSDCFNVVDKVLNEGKGMDLVAELGIDVKFEV